LVDFESVTRKIIDTGIAEQNRAGTATGEDEGEKAFAELLGRGIASLMVGPISEAVKSRFEQWVDNRDDRKDPISLVLLVEAILRLHRQGSSAFTHLSDDKGNTLDITLLHSSDDWKVTAVDGKSLREAIRESADSAGSTATEKAKRTKAMADIHEIQTALDRFYLDNGFYPTTDQGLQALVTRPNSGRVPTKYEDGGYIIQRVPLDPWGNPYFYQSDGNTYALKSYGADGTEGGEGKNADIDASQQ